MIQYLNVKIKFLKSVRGHCMMRQELISGKDILLFYLVLNRNGNEDN